MSYGKTAGRGAGRDLARPYASVVTRDVCRRSTYLGVDEQSDEESGSAAIVGGGMRADRGVEAAGDEPAVRAKEEPRHAVPRYCGRVSQASLGSIACTCSLLVSLGRVSASHRVASRAIRERMTRGVGGRGGCCWRVVGDARSLVQDGSTRSIEMFAGKSARLQMRRARGQNSTG